MSRLDPSGRLPRGVTALTFDDGFTSLYEHALDILTRHRLPATVFLVAATLTDGGHPVDWVDSAPPWPLETLTRTQVLEMQSAGVRFGSHSWSHRVLPSLGPDDCIDDLRRARELLEDLLGTPVPYLAYPRGRHDPVARRAARLAGHTHAFGLPERPERAGPYAVPRVGVYPGNGPRALRIKTARWYLPFRTSPAFPLARRLAGRRSPSSPRSG